MVRLPWWLRCKASAYSVGDTVSIPVFGRSPGEGNCNPLLYSCPGNPMARGAWQAIVHGIANESDMTSWLYNSNNNKILGAKVEGTVALRKDIWEIFTKVINLLKQGFLSGSNGLSGNSQCNIMMTSKSFVWHLVFYVWRDGLCLTSEAAWSPLYHIKSICHFGNPATMLLGSTDHMKRLVIHILVNSFN